MSRPLPPEPGETPEQRQARFDAAYRVHERMKAAMRAEEAAQGRLLSNPFAVMPEMQPVPERPPGYADYLQRPAVSPEMQPVPERPPGYAEYLQGLAVSPVMPEIEVRGVKPPMPVPSASDYISNMIGNGAPPVALPGGSGYDERGNMLKKPAQPRLSDMLRGIGSMMPQMRPMMPMDRGMSPPPSFGLDDNANRPTVNREFNALRERYADQDLRAAINEYYRGGSVMRYR